MLVKSFFYLVNRLFELGVTGLIKTCQRRLRSILWRLTMRKKALAGKAHHSWASIAHGGIKSFEVFWVTIKEQNFVESLLLDDTFRAWMPKQKKNTTDIINHVFDILGSGPTALGKTIDWHCDFKKKSLKQPFLEADKNFSYATYKNTFHTDIPVPQHKASAHTYYEDIKVLWDLARMHHLSVLGLAYQATSVQSYVDAFVSDITSFQDQVNYLLGPHWKCPMDVAIRAINLIWALELFKNSNQADVFWERYISMLYDHLMYLEWNFEESDKPNNHLLADYVGYLYLAQLLHGLPNGKKRLFFIKKKIRAAFTQQILPDGTAYEGSTAYHRLDCELLLHATSLLRVTNQRDAPLESLLEKMFVFLRAVTDHTGNIITIGDDDSGTIVFGLAIQDKKINPTHAPLVHIFPNFGVGIIDAQRFHLSLRAGTTTHQRPSGHVHHDALALTLSINGIPIFVDPGSFVYTANGWWRRYFKAPEQHSTFFVQDEQYTSSDLFQTSLPYQARVITHPAQTTLKADIQLKAASLQRVINVVGDKLIIVDDTIQATRACSTSFNLILDPRITVTYVDNAYTLGKDAQILATVTSTHQLTVRHNAFFSSGYGYCSSTQALTSTMLIDDTFVHKQTIITLV